MLNDSLSALERGAEQFAVQIRARQSGANTPEPPAHVTDLPPITDYVNGADRVTEIDVGIGEAKPNGSRGGASTEAGETSGWPDPIDLTVLASHDPELPQFIIPDWLPAGYATLLAGHGGVGKSAIALHLAVCIAMGLPFAGLPVAQRKVVYLSCEDRAGVLHWRLEHICRHLGVKIADLTGRLDIIELVGHDAMLWDRDPRTGGCFTPAFGQLEARVKASKPQVLIVDGISDTFGGNENSRTDVKRYVNVLLSLVPADIGALILIGHVAKPTATNALTNEGYSGSTGWHNAVRARWYLYPETEQDDDGGKPFRTGRLALELQKSNFGPMDEAIPWRWDEGAHMFLPEEGQSNFDRIHQQRDERRGILLAMQACAASGIHVPAATTGRRTAYHVLSAQPLFAVSMRSGKPAARRFWREIELLRAIRQIRDGSIRREDRHNVATLELTPEGVRACGQ